MPIYEYECLECGARFEMRQSVGDPLPASCPAGHGGVRRRLAAPTIIFKGSGFYVTDHGRNGRSVTAGGKARHEHKRTDEEAGKPGGEVGAGAGSSGKKDEGSSSD